MENNKTVTRTISAGAISSSSYALPSNNLRRHSSAGMRALLWATSSAMSLGSSLGSDLQTSRDNIFPNILTPDSIPQFTIPTLSVKAGGSTAPAESTRERHREEEEEGPNVDEGLGAELVSSLNISPACSALRSSSPSSDLALSPLDRRAQRSISDPLRKSSLRRESSYQGPYTEEVHQHYCCLDPTSRAALSLPHLAKVTTPYGFVTLGQSPQMASEEALLCQAGLHRSSAAKRNKGMPPRYGAKTPVTRTHSVGGIKGDSSHWPAACPGLSKDSTDCQMEKTSSEGDCHAAIAGSSDDSASTVTRASLRKQLSNRKPKRRLYEVIRKHLMPHH